MRFATFLGSKRSVADPRRGGKNYFARRMPSHSSNRLTVAVRRRNSGTLYARPRQSAKGSDAAKGKRTRLVWVNQNY